MSRLNTSNYHHGSLENAILNAATELLEEKGIDSLSLREVARQAKVSPAAPYHHFKNKAELLAAIALKSLNTLDELSEKATQVETHPQKKLEAMGVAYVMYAFEHPSLFKLIFSGGRPLPADMTSASTLPVYRILTRVIDEFDIEDSQKTIAVVSAWSLVHGLSILLIDGPMRHIQDPKDIKQLAAKVTQNLVMASKD